MYTHLTRISSALAITDLSNLHNVLLAIRNSISQGVRDSRPLRFYFYNEMSIRYDYTLPTQPQQGINTFLLVNCRKYTNRLVENYSHHLQTLLWLG